MTNRSLKLKNWPSAHQQAWATAIKPGDILDGTGPASHWAEPTRDGNIYRYGQWLAFLHNHDPALLDLPPGDRCTLEVVRVYVALLQTSTAPHTVSTSVQGLVQMIQVMAPQGDWAWLRRLQNRLKRTAMPSRDKREKMLPAGLIYASSLAELERLTCAPLTKKNLVGFRNALMFAILSSCPIRRKNLAALVLGTSIVRHNERWRIRLSERDTKNHRSFDGELPASLTSHVDHYVCDVLPRLARGKQTHGRLWLTWYGDPMTGHAIYLRMTEASPRLFGKAINPHLMRDCAATALVDTSPDAALAARDLLGHRIWRTTERHYVHANQLEASRKINALFSEIAKG